MLLLLASWLSPLAPLWAVVSAIGKTILEALKGWRTTINGVAVVGLIAGCFIGGLWLSHQAQKKGFAKRDAMHDAAVKKINADVKLLIGVKTGEISTEDDRLLSISKEIREMVAAIPPDVKTVSGPPMQIVVPLVGATKVETKAVKAKSPAVSDYPKVPEYPENLLNALNRINIGER